MGLWYCPNKGRDAGPVAGLFPPQARDWGLDSNLTLTPKASQRVAREGCTGVFDAAARALNSDWGTSYHRKQIQRWTQRIGAQVLACRKAEAQGYAQGIRPSGPANDPVLLVVQMDGGRVQEREKDPDTKSRWHEDKALAVSTFLPGDGKEKKPRALVSTYVATMQKAGPFGLLARIEAERRGIRQAHQVLVLGDAAGFIDTIAEEYFPCHVRIVDYYHAAEHLAACVKALCPLQGRRRRRLWQRWRTNLWQGRIARIMRWLEKHHRRLGIPREADPQDHPRRVIAENLGYFTRHGHQMNYPEYRAKGWPIGSGLVESTIKRFNKRVKGTEQLWNEQGVEPVLALRALWMSQDQRWEHYWLNRRLLRQAA
jgi:hypothetical protein